MLDLSAEDLGLVWRVLDANAPGVKVLAFGSRAQGNAKRYSDLDLALDAGTPLDWSMLGSLKAAFSESDLPIKVDVVDLNDVGGRFRELVLRTAIPLPQSLPA